MMEDTLERKMKAHERGVHVLGKLAVSFGVEVSDADRERWLTLLSLSREIDEASRKGNFYAGDCRRALLSGKAYEQHIAAGLSARFQQLYANSDGEPKQQLERFVHDIVQHNAAIREQRLVHSDVMRQSIDHKSKISDFQATLESDAKYRASIFALPLVGRVEEEAAYRDENAKRVRYNAWLEEFYVAYEHLGALAHAGQDRKSGRHNVEPVGGQVLSQGWLATRSLLRCLAHGTPRTALALLTHGTARVARKLVGRL